MYNLGEIPTWAVPHKYGNERLFANLGYTFPLDERASLELNGTCNVQEDHHAVMEEAREVGTNTSDFLGEATLYLNPVDKLNMVMGFVQEYLSDFHPSDKYFQSIQPYHYYPKSFYGQVDYKIGEDDLIKLVAGTQWNESPLGGSDFVSRYGVVLTPHENWGVKLLRGEAFRGPMGVESDLYHPLGGGYVFMGNKNLQPETITTYDAQLFFHNEKTYAAVTLFQSTSEGTIIYDPHPTYMSYKNGGEIKWKGIEIEGKRFLTPHWHILGSFTRQQNEADAGIYNTSVPNNMFKLGTGYAWDGGSASIFSTYFGEPPYKLQPGTIARNPKPGAMDLVSINVRLDVSKWMGLKKGQSIFTFLVENLLNEKSYTTIAGSDSFPYGPGRMLYAGLRLTF
jgi:outer membrane receptor protein involved in Fe transport